MLNPSLQDLECDCDEDHPGEVHVPMEEDLTLPPTEGVRRGAAVGLGVPKPDRAA